MDQESDIVVQIDESWLRYVALDLDLDLVAKSRDLEPDVAYGWSADLFDARALSSPRPKDEMVALII